jgi:hypothetical protein
LAREHSRPGTGSRVRTSKLGDETDGSSGGSCTIYVLPAHACGSYSTTTGVPKVPPGDGSTTPVLQVAVGWPSTFLAVVSIEPVISHDKLIRYGVDGPSPTTIAELPSSSRFQTTSW